MNKFGDAIEYLRTADKGANGPLEEAAECIEELLGENAELREVAYPTPAPPMDELRNKQHAGAARHWVRRGR